GPASAPRDSLVAMKQVVLRGGSPEVIEVPEPGPEAGRVLVANLASAISTGTERASVEHGGGALLFPVRAVKNPERIRVGLGHLRVGGIGGRVEGARGGDWGAVSAGLFLRRSRPRHGRDRRVSGRAARGLRRSREREPCRGGVGPGQPRRRRTRGGRC